MDLISETRCICNRLTNSAAPASGGARSDWSPDAVPPPLPLTSLLFMALSDSEKENFCPKVFPLKTDLGGMAGVSLILLMPPGDLGREMCFLRHVTIRLGWFDPMFC